MATNITNYTDLQAVVADYLIESAITDSGGNSMVPFFIRMAELEFNRHLRVKEMEKHNRLTTAGDSPNIIALPTDFIKARLVMSSNNRLYPMSLEQVETHYSDLTGAAQHFAVFGSNIRIAPNPGEGAQVDLYYYANIRPLSDELPTNWLLEKHPDLYLYASLAQASGFLKGSDLQIWIDMTAMTIQNLNAMTEQARRGGGAMRLTLRR